MDDVKCNLGSPGCPATCPHRRAHKKTDECGDTERCSYKGQMVKCEKPKRDTWSSQ